MQPSARGGRSGCSGASGIARDVSEIVERGTPMVWLARMAAGTLARVAAKLEMLQPSHSMKDRVSLAVIKDAEASGAAVAGRTTLVAASSGNAAVSLACMAAARGHALALVLPGATSLDVRTLCAAFGATLHLVDRAAGMAGVAARARSLAAATPCSHLLPLHGEGSASAHVRPHYEATGPEIWAAANESVDVLVAGVGGGGAITGTARALRERNPNLQVIAVEPAEVGPLTGLLAAASASSLAVPLDASLISEVARVPRARAATTARQLAASEGLLVDVAGGAAVAAALDAARQPGREGQTVVVLLPSFGERHLSSGVFKHLVQECRHMRWEGAEQGSDSEA